MFQRSKAFLSILVFLSALVVTVAAARAAKQPLTPELVTREYQVVAASINHITWRPGHEEISYVRDDNSGDGLWLYDVASGKARRLDVSGSANPVTYQWSPDGDEILLQGGNDLWIFSVKTGETRRLTNGAAKEEVPTFSPAGDRVAFVKQNNLYTISLKAGKAG